MNEYIKFMDDLPMIAKILFALPFLDILWNVYRLIKSIRDENTLGIVLAVILLLFSTFVWLVDIITLAVYGKVLWFEDTKKDGKKIIDVKNEDKQ
ncbi:MAG: hypothetical protein II669_02240 [Elusimicrobia bacterium]|nr:hypothetical protein [Elusimicrobiota bacterium]